MKKKLITAIFAIILPLLAFTGCGCEHEWVEASCTAPKTCSKCQKTEGEVLAHSWSEADCEHPKTCDVCGLTEGEALGHKEGDWEDAGIDIYEAAEVSKKYCTVCGAEVDRQTSALTSLCADSLCLLYPSELILRLDMMLDNVSDVDYSFEATSMLDWLYEYVYSNGEEVGKMTFANTKDYDDAFIRVSDADSTRFDILHIEYYGSDLEQFTVALIMTCYPTASRSDADTWAKGLLVNQLIMHDDVSILSFTEEGNTTFMVVCT